MDSQVVELLGRNQLVDELLKAGLEIAIPMRDRGIDLIAYADLSPHIQSFAAFPIQMKASSERAFTINRKYARVPNLIIAYVWHVRADTDPVTYALTHEEALGVARQMGWTETASWTEGGRYTTTRPSSSLVERLKQYEMTPERWSKKIAEAETAVTAANCPEPNRLAGGGRGREADSGTHSR